MSPRGVLSGPAVTVHWLEHCETALRAAAASRRPVTLLSAPTAAFTVGPLYFREMVALARERAPEVESLALFDCADAPGRALEALHNGLEAIIFTGPEPQRGRILAIARAGGVRLVTERPPSLDLLDLDRPLEACLAWLRDSPSATVQR